MDLKFSNIINLLRPIVEFIKQLLNDIKIDSVPLISILLVCLFLIIYIRIMLHLPGSGSSIASDSSRLFHRNRRE